MPNAPSPHGPCPICGSGLILQVYGYPLPGQLEATGEDPWADQAGCVLDADSPAYLCRDHEHPLGRTLDDVADEEDDDDPAS